MAGNWRIREWFPELDERAQERLRIYHIELLRWTKKINLISANTTENADLIHFADSILGAKLVLPHIKQDKELWDLGSGNGFPGVVFAILEPSRGVICLDSDERKVAFIKQLSLRLELDSLAARCERLEKLPSGSIGNAVARGLASIDKVLGLCIDKVRVGGAVYHFKGIDWAQEIKEMSPGVRAHWNSSLLGEYSLDLDLTPDSGAARKRAVVVSSRV